MSHQVESRDAFIDKKRDDIETIEDANTGSKDPLLERYALIKEKSKAEIDVLNKSLLQDWIGKFYLALL